MEKILCFGGGSAMPKIVLEELKKYNVEISSVTSMVDSGGSTGRLRKDYAVLPPGDIRRHLVALSNAEEWKKELFRFRFDKGEFKDHNFGNIFIAALELAYNDFEKALKYLHEFLEVKGNCLPATIEKTDVCATLENGGKITGEDEIDVPKKHNPTLKIKEVYLKPAARAYPEVLKKIREADLIVIGPGDLYSSIIPCFLPDGIKEAIQKTKAKKVFICPLMTKSGETQNFSVLDFAMEIEKYIGCKPDFIIFNNFIPDEERVEKCKKENPELIEIAPFEDVPDDGKYIGKNLLVEKGSVIHKPERVVEIILRLCSQ